MAFIDSLKPVAGYLYRNDGVPLNNLQKLAIYAYDESGNPFGPGVAFDADPGPEKVTNGSFTGAATGWTLGAQWAYGTNNVTKSGAGTSTLSQATCAGVANEIYKVVFTATTISAGSITVSIGGVSGTARSTTATTYTEYITATGTGALTFTPSSDFAGTLDDVSVKRVGVAATDRVTAFVGDRLSAGVAQAGKGGLFLQAEDGTRHFFGDRVGFGTVEPGYAFHVVTTTALPAVIERQSTATTPSLLAIYHNQTDAAAGGDGVNLLFDADDSVGNETTYAAIGGAIESATDGAENGSCVFYTTKAGVLTAQARILSAGALLINGTAAYGTQGEMVEVNRSAASGGIGVFCWSTTDAQRGILEFHKSADATIGTKALVALNESLGVIVWKGADGATNWQSAVSMEAFVDATPGAGDMAGRWVLSTSADGGVTPIEAIRVDSTQMARFLAGNVKIANPTDGGTAGLHIRSKRAVSAAMTSGTTANIATQIPSGAMILGASFNVDTAITGATSWAAAFNTGSTTALVTGQAVALNTKANKLVVPEIATAATDITITGSGGDFTAGVIEAIVYYIDQTSMANA